MSKHFQNISFMIYFRNPFLSVAKPLLISIYFSICHMSQNIENFNHKFRFCNQTICNVLCPILYDLISID